MIMPSIKRLVPISELLKYGDKNLPLGMFNPRALPRLATYDLCDSGDIV